MISWEQSTRMLERSRQSLTGGVSSPFRAKAPMPLFFEDGKGARLLDVDGNTYIDYQLAWGPMILGYGHPAMVEALSRQVAKPFSYGAQHQMEFTVAEQICDMVPCAERVAFTSSGSEAVQLAQRLARAFTGRPLILKFEGHYHGWMDSALWSYKPQPADTGSREQPNVVPGSRGQVPNAADNCVVSVWNDLDRLQAVLEANSGRVGAVMMEPVLCNSGCLMPRPGYLEGVRELARRYGALLIFDEVITGFRIGPGGAQQRFGVTPDLATFGKAVGGGVPLSVIAGRADIMEQMCADVVFGGTFNGNPLSLAGAHVCLTELARDNGAALAHANRMGELLGQGIRDLASRHGIPLQVTGFGTASALHFTARTDLVDYRDTLSDDRARLQQFLHAALRRGVILVPDGRIYVSAAHNEDDIAETLDKLAGAFEDLGTSGSTREMTGSTGSNK